MPTELPSGCPINLTLEVLGDRWSLIIVRDIMFGDRRHYRELLLSSEEGISSNILAERLKTLLEQGILTKADDPTHKQKAIYSLTEQGIELLPILAQICGWGVRYLPVTEELGVRVGTAGEPVPLNIGNSGRSTRQREPQPATDQCQSRGPSQQLRPSGLHKPSAP
jgi:DNA-binding HxlR family transcriptional regulator